MEEDSQQDKKRIVGQVIDENGYPLPGATALIKGRPNGAITDNEGRFELNVSERDVLVVSYLGYIEQEVDVRGKTSLTIKMEPLGEIEEVVVTAFGQQKKESIVASIETISPKDLRVPSSNLTTALAGRVAGLISYQRSGEPGKDNAEFFIRGVTTFGYAQSPMILLDGFEVSANELAQVDPDNIENFSIMKDATAAALYGSKGANGVISVTTKMGREGKLAISFRHESRFSMPTMLPETIDGISYMKLYNEALHNDTPLAPPRYSTDKINGTAAGLNPMIYPNIDWYDAMFEKFTYNSHYALNASGGGKIARYYMAVAWDRDTGILKDNDINNFRNNIDINRYNILAKINVNLTNTTRLDLSLNSIFQDYQGPLDEATAVFNSVMAGNPVEFPMIWKPDEKYQYVRHVLFGIDSDASMTNPYANMVRGYRDGFASNIITQATLEQDLHALTKGLIFRAKFSIGAEGSNMTTRSYAPFYYTLKEYDKINDVYKNLNNFFINKNPNIITFNSDSSTLLNKLALNETKGCFMYNGDAIYSALGGDNSSNYNQLPKFGVNQNFWSIIPKNNFYAMDGIVISKNIDNQKMDTAIKLISDLCFSGINSNEPIYQLDASNPNKYKFLSMSNFAYVNYTPCYSKIYNYATDPKGYFYNETDGDIDIVNFLINLISIDHKKINLNNVELPINETTKSNMDISYVEFKNSI